MLSFDSIFDSIFDENGELPEGIHEYTIDMFKHCFVDIFRDSKSRISIYQGFNRFNECLFEYGCITKQWIDGSFVTIKNNPNDIDEVTFFNANEINKLTIEKRQSFEQLIKNEDIKKIFSTHHFNVFEFPSGHPRYQLYCEQLKYWQKWFGTSRPIVDKDGNELPPRKKGIVQLSNIHVKSNNAPDKGETYEL